VRGRRPAARLPLVVGHGHLRELQAELTGQRPHQVVSVQHELGAALDHGARVTGHQFLRPHPAANPVPRLEHHHLVTSLSDPVRGQQAREPGARHHHAHARSLQDLAA
jgi:hypothetical protein